MSMERLRREWSYDTWRTPRCYVTCSARVCRPPMRSACSGTSWAPVRVAGAARGRQEHAPIWPALTLDELGNEHERLRAGWTRFLEELSEGGLERELSYTNSKGQPWKTRVDDILEHVLMHGAYHAGRSRARCARPG